MSKKKAPPEKPEKPAEIERPEAWTGGTDWTAVLPALWRGNPNVVALTAPASGKPKVMILKDGTMLGVVEQTLESGRTLYQGVQVIYPELNGYNEHEEIFAKLGMTMLPPRYIGPLVGVPNSLLTGDMPVFLVKRDAMSQPYLDVAGYMRKRFPQWETAND